MPTLSDEEQELIQKDREENPGCFYSTALSQSCRSMNGDSKCEIIKKIFRQCPGSRKQLISNRKEITEDEHSGETSTGDFFNRERMDPRRAGDQEGDDFEAQMSPFDFLRQEMLRPFEDFFGGGMLGGRESNPFEGFEGEFERMPMHPPSPTPNRPSRQAPSNPPHYSFQPSQGKNGSEADAKVRAQGKSDIFADYSGRVDEI
ncbi:hypothetical protein BBO99_00002021 [Phytophthora kernoviae]|uniref:Uncharacterized protein n=2 Tax=Phytophthora kernoviae TaxID=325452 RepID=A0A3R7K3M1_9STRA|nr:hypothetical protein G195_000848 [Phytophthora kernoviae 00238/432]KAG2532833.1 hypothetical protein JM16_000026 [Phytophthora kernoviae]KAG2533567.1 hypothetical protein JM18_000028 [Phytophthora kernoviae]RLN11037.1 hypothetical protein BBI17_000192 [Phytophthora kernoviae]RLN86142.1 hypothetical protein BBO99_00002021 [Phytophthora kernoviae]